MSRFYYDYIKIIMAFLMAGIASLGTMPYGFRYAQGLALYNADLALGIGVLLALAAAICNIALGAHSLLKAQFKQTQINVVYIFILSLSGALPNGFMFYFAYKPLLPLPVNIFASTAVTIINAAIGYTAMLNVISLLKTAQFKFDRKDIPRVIGTVLGLIASLTSYAAAAHGLTNLLATYIEKTLAFKVATFLSIMLWLPNAALFSNAMREATAKVYDFFTDFSYNLSKIRKEKIILFIFVCCSGTSFLQIAHDLFSLQMNIPDILKTPSAQWLIHHFIFPLTFLSSTAVNYFALQNILSMREKQSFSSDALDKLPKNSTS